VHDVLVSRDQTDEQIEAVVSQMFGACLWTILTKSDDQDKVLENLMKRVKIER
jgi:hypothetical protein